MANNAAVCGDAIAPLARGGAGKLARLSDDELLAGTRRLIGATNQILAELLTHLAEVETRRIYRARLCTSLYTYCVYELRLSEDAAFRRVSAARLVQRFPALYDAIATGELHLTGLLMLGPHLTPENIGEVLPRAKHRTKKELAQLVRQLDPLPDVPARIQPLGPGFELPRTLRAPTWQEACLALNPVNHLRVGQRPREWMSEAPLAIVSETADCEVVTATSEIATADTGRSEAATSEAATSEAATREPALARVIPVVRPVPLGQLVPLQAPQRYQVQFTAGQEYVDLVERARALLSDTSRGELAELHLRAMRSLVSELEKRKYATHAKVGEDGQGLSDSESAARSGAEIIGAGAEREAGEAGIDRAGAGGERGVATEMGQAGAAGEETGADDDEIPRWRGRYIPAGVRRAVAERDGLRCSYVDEGGRRCGEMRWLEFHHVVAFARGGEHSVANVTLRCRCHNLLAAEEDFGRERMQRAREGQAHEALARQVASDWRERSSP